MCLNFKKCFFQTLFIMYIGKHDADLSVEWMVIWLTTMRATPDYFL